MSGKPALAGSRTLSLRLMLATLLCSAVIALVVCAVQIYIACRDDSAGALDRFGQIEAAYLPGIAASLWEVDSEGVVRLLEGISRLPGVGRVVLTDETGASWRFNAQTSSARIGSRTFAMVYREAGQRYPLGTLAVELDNGAILARLTDRAVAITITSVSSLLLGSLCLLFLVRHGTTCHLEAMARFVRAAPRTNSTTWSMPSTRCRTPCAITCARRRPSRRNCACIATTWKRWCASAP
jgi:hypothetical protein